MGVAGISSEVGFHSKISLRRLLAKRERTTHSGQLCRGQRHRQALVKPTAPWPTLD